MNAPDPRITRATAPDLATNPVAGSEARLALPHWAQAYVGLPYIVGVGECGHRAALVWREVFGLTVEAAPAFGDLGAAQGLIKAALDGPTWTPVLVPAEGDAVVMWKGSLLAHVGVWVEPGLVLHCTRAEGMVLTPETALEARGFRVAGRFRHVTAWAMAA